MIRQSTVLVPECVDLLVPICDFSPENDPPNTVLVPECADFRIPICVFSPENDPPNTVLVPECADLLVHFGSKGIQKVTFRANYRRAQACSTAISPSQEIQTERDRQQTDNRQHTSDEHKI